MAGVFRIATGVPAKGEVGHAVMCVVASGLPGIPAGPVSFAEVGSEGALRRPGVLGSATRSLPVAVRGDAWRGLNPKSKIGNPK